MSQSIAEKILSRQSLDKMEVFAGDRVDAIPNTILSNEMLPMVSMTKFWQTGAKNINQDIRKKMLIILDHGGWGTSSKFIDLHQMTRDFAKKHDLHLMDVGSGISHVVFHELGYARPGYLIVGTDSHTVTHGAFNSFSKGIGGSDLVEIMIKGYTWFDVPQTNKIILEGELGQNVYSKDILLHINGEKKMNWATDKAIEWTGDTIASLSMEARLTMSNMAVEQGAVAGIMPFDGSTARYLNNTVQSSSPSAHKASEIRPVHADRDTEYHEVYEIDVSEVQPSVAIPHSPDNIKPISELSKIELDQVFIGSCTNARIEDLEVVANILKGQKVKVRTLIIPGSSSVGLEAAKRGYVQIFMEAGATWSYSTCGACYGGNLGLLGPNMTALSTTNRNFIGRMGGDESSQVYLASPATAAASALAGYIVEAGK